MTGPGSGPLLALSCPSELDELHVFTDCRVHVVMIVSLIRDFIDLDQTRRLQIPINDV